MSAPEWLRGVVEAVGGERGLLDTTGINPVLQRTAAAGESTRPASVLVLFGGSPEPDHTARGGLPADADVLLTQRASTLRQHSGQIAFPGGATDPGDVSPVATALREAEEETGLDPAGVQPLATMPGIYVPPSRFDVIPVLAYWRRPSDVRVVDTGESARVVRVPIQTLLDPDNRFQVRHPAGYQGPAFAVDGMLVWGFTGGILAGLLAVSGWETEWDTGDIRDLEASLAAVGAGLDQ
ncbi:CoA pyrophosphatase [Rhodococcus sp. PAMC28707]|uniref:NUDIX hydrolase n=1 Tax=unclassified Rhodococcus (in: high G+C Gram-positive bacteria) TaxID=192944 RepID=UPI00109E1AD8|nr:MULTISPECIES: CoA pyrophosphatase [unclassified Rhodococcus (in: high G+C Gram-positive bacteria)]QCB49227.1 CoA pyrophosphatase [Rhodococcus sp. PAMC28705]QCB59085.1 CoA pyrophosphatase [Rhodococcus sp. PAMC28707]